MVTTQCVHCRNVIEINDPRLTADRAPAYRTGRPLHYVLCAVCVAAVFGLVQRTKEPLPEIQLEA